MSEKEWEAVVNAALAVGNEWKTRALKAEAELAKQAKQTQPCDMGALCLDCQPRGPKGECPDKQARRRF